MKLLITILTIFYFSSDIHSQTFNNLYNRGVEEFHAGNLERANSLFTLAIERVPDKNLYFNRGMVRKALSDSCGYCNDMLICSLYFSDKEARILFRNDCVEWADTIYISNKHIHVERTTKYKYLDVFLKQNCYNDPYGIIYNTKRTYEVFGMPPTSIFNAFNLGFYESNIYGMYDLVDSTKIYTYMVFKPSIDCKVVKESKVINQVRNLILENQPKLDTDSFNKIPISVIISPEGELIKIKCNLKEVNIDQFIEILEPLQLLLVKNYTYPKAKILGEYVFVEYSQLF